MAKVKATFGRAMVVAESSQDAQALYDQSRYGELVKGKFQYSFVEALYLVEKKRMDVLGGRGKSISYDDFVKKASKKDKRFWIRYCVFADMRDRGYVVKTALKFGADFRVYDRGKKPGEAHAKWVLYAVGESERFTWHEFAAKNRVAHSTKKSLLLGIVDDESSVSFYNVNWIRP